MTTRSIVQSGSSDKGATRRRGPLFAAVGAAVIVVVVGALVIQRVRTVGTHVGAPPPPKSNHRYTVVGADSHGSVVEDSYTATLIGYGPAGTRLWSMPLGSRGLGLYNCLSACPNVTISGSVATLTRPEVADPPILWRVGDRTVSEPAGIGGNGKALVLAAASPDVAILAESDLTGQSRIELRDRPHPNLYLSAPSDGATVKATRDLTAAIILTPSSTAAQQSDLHWYTRDASGWRLRSRSLVTAVSGCIDANGQLAVLTGPSTRLIGPTNSSGVAIPLSETGDCVFDELGPVVTGNMLGAAGAKTVIQQLDRTGKTLWSHTLEVSGSVSAAPDGVDVVVTDGSSYLVFDRRGVAVKKGSGVQWASAAGGHELLVVDSSGNVRIEAV